jgi:hypothetical protein
VTFTGPEVPGAGGIVHEENMKIQYSARIGRGGVGLEMSLYSPEAWSSIRNSVRFPSGAHEVHDAGRGQRVLARRADARAAWQADVDRIIRIAARLSMAAASQFAGHGNL